MNLTARTSLTLLATLAMLAVEAVQVNVSFANASCGLCNGTATASITGGIPPYALNWSPAPPSGQGTTQVQGLCAGNWSVVVTDGQGDADTATFIIVAATNLPAVQTQGTLSDCQGTCSGWSSVQPASLGGTAPYTFGWGTIQTGIVGPGWVTFQGLCAGSTPITVTDANGCTGTIDAVIMNESPGTTYVNDVFPACGGAANGAATVYYYPGDILVYHVQGVNIPFDSLYTFSSYSNQLFQGLPAGDFIASPMWSPGWGGGYLDLWCSIPAYFTVPDLPVPCGSVSGTVYHDADQDCILNNFDLPLPWRVLSISPGGLYTITDANGHYTRNLPFGTFTIDEGALQDELPTCPGSGSAQFTLSGGNTDDTLDFANLSTVPHDLSVFVNSGVARPGFPTQVWVSVHNNSAFPSGTVDLSLVFDPLLLNPVPANGQWSLGTVGPYQTLSMNFTALVPPDVQLIGTPLTYAASVTNTASELTLANNAAAVTQVITGSYDPNDKQGRTSTGWSDTEYFLGQDGWVDYTVRFQNTGTDTAFTVVLRDTLDADLDPMSLRILGASHAFTPSFGDDRELVFTFDDILLPDSGANMLGSQGYVAFRLRPVNGVQVGAVLSNTAHIYFDLNPPITTNTVNDTVELSTAIASAPSTTMLAWPNPADDVLFVRLPSGPGAGLRLLAADGRVVPVHARRQGEVLQLDVAGLEPGIYLLHSRDGVARFVKR